MTDLLARPLVRLLLGTELAGTGPDGGSHFLAEGLSWRRGEGGTLEVALPRLELASLRLVAPPFELQVARVALQSLQAQLQPGDDGLRLGAVRAASAVVSGLRVQGPLAPPAGRGGAAPGGAWALAPLAAANGTLRALITDAHLGFDADVTVPVRQGHVNFNDAGVAHFGPDSRMGVSRLGLYVDAPNGRSYLYQFTSPAVAGIEYESRGAMLGPWVTSRGKLQLQPFAEGLLRQGPGAAGLGFTEQARLLLARTALSGDLQLGDGDVAVPGLRARLTGRDEGRNAIRVHAEAVGRGLTATIASLALRDLAVASGQGALQADTAQGTLSVRLFAEAGEWRFSLDVERLEVGGPRSQPG